MADLHFARLFRAIVSHDQIFYNKFKAAFLRTQDERLKVIRSGPRAQ
jgi:hypothetical protein